MSEGQQQQTGFVARAVARIGRSVGEIAGGALSSARDGFDLSKGLARHLEDHRQLRTGYHEAHEGVVSDAESSSGKDGSSISGTGRVYGGDVAERAAESMERRAAERAGKDPDEGKGRKPTARGGKLENVPADDPQQIGLGQWEPQKWYHQRPPDEDTPGPMNRLSFGSLRLMGSTAFISPIIHEIERQVSIFAQPRPNRDAIGFDVELTDSESKAKGADKKRVAELIRFTQNCGWWTNENMLSRRRAPFVRFLRLAATNLSLYDGAPIEVIHDKAFGRVPAAFQAVAGNTIRMVVPHRDETGAIDNDPDAPAFCQVWRNQIWREWSAREMAYVSLRPRLDFESHGYGWPPLEELVDVVTYLLWLVQYNAMQFRQGLLGNGLITVKGNFSASQWDAFQDYFQQLMTGVTNAHRVGFLNLPGKEDEFKFDTLGRQTNRDGEYMPYMRLLMQIACAVYGIDPLAAYGMLMGPEGQSQTMGAHDPSKRADISWAKSIPHIMVELEYALNTHIFNPMTAGEFSLRFRGMDEELESARYDRQKKMLEVGATFDEIRAENDWPELGPENGGHLVANSQWMQWKLAQEGAERAKEEQEAAMAEQGAAAGGAEGEGAAGGGGGGMPGLIPPGAPGNEQGAAVQGGAAGEQGAAGEEGPEDDPQGGPGGGGVPGGAPGAEAAVGEPGAAGAQAGQAEQRAGQRATETGGPVNSPSAQAKTAEEALRALGIRKALESGGYIGGYVTQRTGDACGCGCYVHNDDDEDGREDGEEG